MKKNTAKIKGCMWYQLLYLIPGAIVCSKFDYSDFLSVKPPLPQSFSFFFFIEEIFKNGKYTVEMRTHSLGFNPPPPVRTLTLSSWLLPPPTCVRTLWMVSYVKNNIRLDHSPSSKNKVSWISTGSSNINLVCIPHKASVTFYFITFPSQTLHSEFSNDRNKGKNKLKKCIKQLKMISSYDQIFPRGFFFFLAAQLLVACLHGTTFLTLTSVYIAILSSTCCWSLISSPTLVHRLDHCNLGRCSFVWNRVGLTCKIPAYLRR